MTASTLRPARPFDATTAAPPAAVARATAPGALVAPARPAGLLPLPGTPAKRRATSGAPPPVRNASARRAHACRLDAEDRGGARDVLVRPAAAADGATLRLTRRGRTVAVGGMAVGLLLLSVGGPSMATSGAPPVAVYRTVTVHPGQSLWEIADAAAPGVDTRATVARIIELNGLGAGGLVHAGEQIVVPATPD